MRALPLLCALGLTLAGATARADLYKELHGLRSEAMGGAHRGLGTSNDAIALNAGGLALIKRYSIDGMYAYSRQDDLHHLSLSVLDSKTGPVAGALQYSFTRGDHAHADVNLHRIYLSSGYAILDNFGFGITTKNIRGDFRDEKGERQNVETYSFDLGFALYLFEALGIGVSYQNVVTSSRKRLNPPHLGIGLAWADDDFAIVADMEIDLREKLLGEIAFKTGAEYFLAGQFPIRIGYRAVPFTRRYCAPRENKETGCDVRDFDHVLGGGIGWITETGSVEVTYTHSAVIQKNWDIFAALKFYM